MKVKDMFDTNFEYNYGSVDVYNSETDDWAIGYDAVALTEEGRRKFADVLELEVEMYCNNENAVVTTNGSKQRRAVRELFESAAGYCAEEQWDAWFELI